MAGTFSGFMKQNVAPYAAAKIGVYNSNGERVGSIPLGSFKPEYGERLYRFGVLSDVHNETSQADGNQEDIRNALTFFNEKEDVEFTIISGDLTQTSYSSGNLSDELRLYSENLNAISNRTPVYPTTGNHDCPQSSDVDIDTWKRYTGTANLYTADADYSYEVTKTHGTVTDHFLFLGMKRYEFSTNTYSTKDITWLGNKLEEYKNDRCFVITHMFFPDASGNFRSIYPSGNWLSGTMLSQLQALRNAYPRSIWFSGHSHWKWYLQQWEEKANVWPLTNVSRTSSWCVHIPSCASPIDSNVGNPSLSSNRVSMEGQSEGAIVDVYENYIDIRAICFKDAGDTYYSKKYIPIAQYRLYTAPGSDATDGGNGNGSGIGGGSTTPDTPDDGSVYVTASMISENAHKVTGATWSVNDETHTLTVTFNAGSQGILFNDGTIADTDFRNNNIHVYFDNITYNLEPSETAKSYIGLYDGTNYTNTSGMTAGIYESSPYGVQINSSSRFEANGGSYPITLTYTNLRFKRE